MPAKNRASKKPASVAAAKIVQEALRDDVTVSELAEMAQSDPAMALRIVALVNSPAFQLSHPVSDVGRAAAILGLRGLRNIALALMLTDMIPPGEEGQAIMANSLRRALACRAIAVGLGASDRDVYFTTGLFLDAGYLIHANGDLCATARIVRSPAAHRILRERAISWEPHTVVGSKLASDYGLPKETVDAIQHHHDDSPPEHLLARAAWLAERIAAVFEGGDPAELVAVARDAAASIGLEEAVFEAILAELPQSVRDSAQSMECEISTQLEFEQLVHEAQNGLVRLNQQYEELVRILENVISEKDLLAQRLQSANEELEELAMTDALTKLPNKRCLEEFLRHTMARAERDNSVVSLLMIDVDHFKHFNDTYGHAAGDLVLSAVGQALLDNVRAGDMAARFGGEEFTVVLPGTSEEGALLVADRMRQAIEAARVISDKGQLCVTASVGVATMYGVRASSRDELFEVADAAMYQSKAAGRNRVTVSVLAAKPSRRQSRASVALQ
ncbi:MAG: diguanylate cyclase [Kofleriaceae bacterium]|nr:diguanylate cyclase [Kofleriaceae bacterium]